MGERSVHSLCISPGKSQTHCKERHWGPWPGKAIFLSVLLHLEGRKTKDEWKVRQNTQGGNLSGNAELKSKSFKGLLSRKIKIYGVVWILLWNASQPETGYTNKLQKWQLFKGDQKTNKKSRPSTTQYLFVFISWPFVPSLGWDHLTVSSSKMTLYNLTREPKTCDLSTQHQKIKYKTVTRK